MFDPPDYPYKELTETLKDYGTDDLLFSNECTTLPSIDNLGVTSTTKLNRSIDTSEVSFQQNDSGRYFTTEPVTLSNSIANGAEFNAELLIIQSENILHDAPTLLDENTVNQFLLPVQVTSEEKKDDDKSVPDLLALQSCVLCHEIFTTDTELLNHTVRFHASDDTIEQSLHLSPSKSSLEDGLLNLNSASNTDDLEMEWFVCCVCDRIIATTLEAEPTEQICCSSSTSESTIKKQKLHTMFVCDFCNGLFASAKSLDKHKNSCNTSIAETYYYTLHDTNTNVAFEDVESPQRTSICFTCDSCKMQCSTSEELEVHQSLCLKLLRPKITKNSYVSSANSKMWNCGSCNQLFATARELYRHKRGEDRPAGAPLTAYVCEECDKVLGSMCALHTHRKMHKVTKPGYPCRICGRRFNQSGHLAIHMRMHTGERPYPCDLCPKAFKVKVERDDHRRTHTGERPFACTACPKTFTAAARLREHARIHTDQRPYRCDICGAAFRRPYARTVHTLIHTGEKPHECSICGTAFRRSGDMWKHKRTIHQGPQLTESDKKGM